MAFAALKINRSLSLSVKFIAVGLTLFAFAALPFAVLSAQSKHCDKLILNGDTTIC